MHVLGVLQQLFLGNHAFKFRPVHEVVVDPVLFPHPWTARGIGHGEIDVFPLAQQLGNHGAFSHAGGPGKDDQLSLLLFFHHSKSSSPVKRPEIVSGGKAESTK